MTTIADFDASESEALGDTLAHRTGADDGSAFNR